MFGLCEGNFCEGGAKGQERGNGRLVVFTFRELPHNASVGSKHHTCQYVHTRLGCNGLRVLLPRVACVLPRVAWTHVILIHVCGLIPILFSSNDSCPFSLHILCVGGTC